MIIKNHPSGNEYIFSGDTWVRNFTKQTIAAIQISNLFQQSDYGIVLKNEQLNKNLPKISDEKINFKKIVIVSDGYDFDKKHLLISKFPKDVCVLAVNKALQKWKLLTTSNAEDARTINAYVINNPYAEAINFLPNKGSQYFPTCIASTRTNHDFIAKYKGDIYLYRPTFETSFSFDTPELYHIDDYRNPICAAIGLAYRFGVEKLMLMCCDDAYKNKRQGTVQMPNGLWTYPPHLRSQEIIDANLHWLTHQENKEVKVVDYSSGLDYKNAAYIKDEGEVCSFFIDQVEGTPNE